MKHTQGNKLRLIFLVVSFILSPSSLLPNQNQIQQIQNDQQLQQALQQELAQYGFRGFGNMRLGEGARIVIRNQGRDDIQIIGEKNGFKIIDKNGERHITANNLQAKTGAQPQPQPPLSPRLCEPYLDRHLALTKTLIHQIKETIPEIKNQPEINALLLRFDSLTLQIIKNAPIPARMKIAFIFNPLLTSEMVREKIIQIVGLED